MEVWDRLKSEVESPGPGKSTPESVVLLPNDDLRVYVVR